MRWRGRRVAGRWQQAQKVEPPAQRRMTPAGLHRFRLDRGAARDWVTNGGLAARVHVAAQRIEGAAQSRRRLELRPLTAIDQPAARC